MELKTYKPDYIDEANHCLYWKLENAKEMFNSFDDVLKKYYELNREDVKQRRIEKMKAEQLRVGNWVIGIEENDYYQITSSTITMMERGEGSHIRPVPISPTWLRQLRFENCINGWWSKDEMLNFKLNDDGNEIYLHGSDTNLANYPIDYVHELQNIYYSIFGKELY